MKVLHVAATANGAHWMFEIVRELREKGYDASAMISGTNGDLAGKLRGAGIPFLVGDLEVLFPLNPFSVLRKVLALARFLREGEYTIVHCHLFPSIILGRAAGWIAGVPLRFSMNTGPYYLEAPAPRALERITAWTDTRVIASCEYARRLYHALGVPWQRLERIFYGPNPYRFDPAAADPGKLRQDLGLPAGIPLVGMVARLYAPLPAGPWTPPHLQGRAIKGHETLLEAALLIAKARPEAKIIIIGAGWEAPGEIYERELREQAHRMGLDGTVIFTGQRSDIPDVLAGLDVSVQCSRNENLGGTIESLLMGRPTVASAIGGMVDSVRHDETGLLVPPDDPAALSAAILELLDDPARARRLGENGRALMLREFTLTKTVDDIDQLYRQLLDDGRPASRSRNTMGRRLRSALRVPAFGFRLFLLVVPGAARTATAMLRRTAQAIHRRTMPRRERTTRRMREVLLGGFHAGASVFAEIALLALPAAAALVVLPHRWRIAFLAGVALSGSCIRLLYRGPSRALLRLLNKRLLDAVIAALLLAASAPLWLLAAWSARGRGGLFARVPCLGRAGERFEAREFLMPGATAGRLSVLHRLLRRPVIRLLPRLLAVLHGRISLVGPALLSPTEAGKLPDSRRRRFEVKPGLLACGGARLPGADEGQRESWYVDHWSMWVDLWVLVSHLSRGSCARPGLRPDAGESPTQP